MVCLRAFSFETVVEIHTLPVEELTTELWLLAARREDIRAVTSDDVIITWRLSGSVAGFKPESFPFHQYCTSAE